MPSQAGLLQESHQLSTGIQNLATKTRHPKPGIEVPGYPEKVSSTLKSSHMRSSREPPESLLYEPPGIVRVIPRMLCALGNIASTIPDRQYRDTLIEWV